VEIRHKFDRFCYLVNFEICFYILLHFYCLNTILLTVCDICCSFWMKQMTDLHECHLIIYCTLEVIFTLSIICNKKMGEERGLQLSSYIQVCTYDDRNITCLIVLVNCSSTVIAGWEYICWPISEQYWTLSDSLPLEIVGEDVIGSTEWVLVVDRNCISSQSKFLHTPLPSIICKWLVDSDILWLGRWL